MTNRFRRRMGERRYKRMFIIVTEGTVTERQYFHLFEDGAIVHIKCIRNRNNLPPNEALKEVKSVVAGEGLRKRDEAWVVVDRDSWQEPHLDELYQWSQSRNNFGFALSNPKFEYWLLLHFEDANQVVTGTECDIRLKTHLPEYDKHIEKQHFDIERIRQAVMRARRRDTPPCDGWPKKAGSTVYQLVEKILGSRQ